MFRKFKEIISQIMTIVKQIIGESGQDTSKQLVKLKKEVQNMNSQHRKEWKSIHTKVSQKLGQLKTCLKV